MLALYFKLWLKNSPRHLFKLSIYSSPGILSSVICYRVIVAPYVRSVGHVFAYHYTLDDDSECPMDYESSLLPEVFPFFSHVIMVSGLGSRPQILSNGI